MNISLSVCPTLPIEHSNRNRLHNQVTNRTYISRPVMDGIVLVFMKWNLRFINPSQEESSQIVFYLGAHTTAHSMSCGFVCIDGGCLYPSVYFCSGMALVLTRFNAFYSFFRSSIWRNSI